MGSAIGLGLFQKLLIAADFTLFDFATEGVYSHDALICFEHGFSSHPLFDGERRNFGWLDRIANIVSRILPQLIC
jgi:hypothetical protein